MSDHEQPDLNNGTDLSSDQQPQTPTSPGGIPESQETSPDSAGQVARANLDRSLEPPATDGNDPNQADKASDGYLMTQEALSQLPPQVREIVEGSMLMMHSGPLPSPVSKNIRPEHISKLLDNAEEGAKRSSAQEERDSDREFRIKKGQITALSLMGVGVIIFLIVLIVAPGGDPSPFRQGLVNGILFLLAGIVAGLGAGFQLGRRSAERD